MDMEIDRQTIKALSADTRIEILKLLSKRRMISADISKKLDLAASTVLEHLQKLEQAGLVKRKETEHKWIYYEITEKGKNLIMPKLPINIILSLSIGVILTFVSIINFYMFNVYTSAQGIMQKTTEISAPQEIATSAPMINWFFVIFLIAGVLLIILSLIKMVKW